MTFVTLAAAKAHLYMTDPARDLEVTAAVERASEIIWDYLAGDRRPANPWTETDAPKVVQAATLRWLGHLWEHRGDELAEDAPLWDATARLLVRMRDPGVA